MSAFSGYEKMPTSIKKLGLKENDFSMMEKWQWVVTEKIHGANFSFIYENKQLKFAKRKDYLHWQDDFFGFQLVVSSIENQVIQLFEDIQEKIEAEKHILYGELFGGFYPHPNVEAAKNVHAIQTGVYYSPNIEFCAFDIAYVSNQDTDKQYLDYKTACTLFEKHDIFFAKPLFIGKFNEASDFDTRINSVVPKSLQLPDLNSNLIEGIVIKPWDKTGYEEGIDRPILKIKNKEFDEDKKFHEAEKWSYIPDIRSKSEELSYILEELDNYINTNRLESAISKIGALDIDKPDRINEIKNEVVRDALDDFNINNDNLLGELSKEDIEWLRARLLASSSVLINQNYETN